MTENDSPTLSHDTAFDLLSNARRRLILRQLQETGAVELGELATELAAIENEVDPDELSAQQRKRTYVSLYQTHIPKLENAGVVTFDPETGMVRPTGLVDDLATYFETESSSVAWEWIYLIVAVVGLLTYGLAIAIGGPVDPAYVGFGALLLVVIVSSVHVYRDRVDREPTTIPAASR